MKTKQSIFILSMIVVISASACANKSPQQPSQPDASKPETTAIQTTAVTESATNTTTTRSETTTETTAPPETETTVSEQAEKRPEHYYYENPAGCFYYAAEFYCNNKVANVDYHEQTITMEDGQKILCTGFDSNLGMRTKITEMLISDIEDYYFNTDDLPEGYDGEIIYTPGKEDDENYIVKTIDENEKLSYLECVWRKAEEVSGEKVTEITYYDIGFYSILTTKNGKKYLAGADFGLTENDIVYRDFSCKDPNEYLTENNIDKRMYGYPDDLETYDGIILYRPPQNEQ